MKIICECGNEMKFNTVDADTGEEHPYTDGEGQYANGDFAKFEIWEMHDVVGIVCRKCDKDIWMFT